MARLGLNSNLRFILCIFFVVGAKVLNLPPSLASKTSLLILARLIHGPTAPKNMQPFLLCILDDLIPSWQGLKTVNPITKEEAIVRFPS